MVRFCHMSDRIFKYSLEVEQRQLLHLPSGAELLSVAVVNGQPALFVCVHEGLVAVDAEPRVVRTVRTGERFNAEGSRFIGTLVFEQEGHTFHVFEQTEGASDPVEPRFQDDYAQVRDGYAVSALA